MLFAGAMKFQHLVDRTIPTGLWGSMKIRFTGREDGTVFVCGRLRTSGRATLRPSHMFFCRGDGQRTDVGLKYHLETRATK